MWQAEPVDPWTIGLVVLIVLGLAATIYGALSDRAKNRRRAAEMLAPPDRPIPAFSPTATPPRYLSELQARRPPPDAVARTLSDGERAELAARLSDASTVTIDAGYLSEDFVTDPVSGWAVLDGAAVLVCSDDVASIRELLPTLERAILGAHPVVIVADCFEARVRSTLEVNAVQGKLAVIAIVANAADRARIAATTGATPTERTDRQAGYVPPEHLGHCARWVSTARRSHLC